MTEKPTGLSLLRVPFEAHHISKKPAPTAKQTADLKLDFKLGIRCKECGGWHHRDVVHLDYVGHAALTDRLLDADPQWNWEPLGLNADGSPVFDNEGGMWINLTVCGVTRMGYGHADGKKGGNAIKEVIGDALRNAAMRFGAALDLWHKGDLHADEEPVVEQTKHQQRPRPITADEFMAMRELMDKTASDEAGLLKFVGASDLQTLDLAQYEKAMAALRKKAQMNAE